MIKNDKIPLDLYLIRLSFMLLLTWLNHIKKYLEYRDLYDLERKVLGWTNFIENKILFIKSLKI